jgi:diaminohydroxyphosphoribosylaminopyrimidine deaminase / 5-amino-6-(5-phosphoribosylamino)uracil reductase
MKWSNYDIVFMKRALELAEKGCGKVSPNPMVGCVLVKNDTIIGEGYHRKFGGDHAEVAALKDCHHRTNGATAYITLEPCTHNGKTPPCVEALIDADVKRVVFATKDPNPRVNGKAARILKKAGIDVVHGCLSHEAESLNEGFISVIKRKIPFVAMKVAASLDGRIATRSGQSKWITSAASRKRVHVLRDKYDAILVGIGTVLADNPELAGSRRKPRRIILDSRLRISPSAKVLRDNNVLVVTTIRSLKKRRDALERKGIPVLVMKKIEVKPLLKLLAKEGVTSLFVEGGSEVFSSFVDARAVDKLYWFVAPLLIGGVDAKMALSGKGVSKLTQSLILDNYNLERLSGSTKAGDDILIEGGV